MKKHFEESLINGIKRMNNASDQHKKDELTSSRVISEDLEIDELILTHSYSQSAAQKILGVNHIVFKQIVDKAIDSGIIEKPLKLAHSYKYTIAHIHALQDYLNIKSWKDKFKGLEVIVVNNLKGGTGKTTFCVSLCVELALQFSYRPRILCIDLDPQGSIAQYTNLDMNDASILTGVDLMLGDNESDSVYQQYKSAGYSHEELVKGSVVSTHIPNLKILPSHPNDGRYIDDLLKMKLQAIRNNPETKDCVFNDLLQTKIIDHIKDDFDIVIIDTTPQKNVLVATAMDAATGLLVPCTPHALDWDATQKHLNSFISLIKDETPSTGDKLKWWKVAATNFEDEFGRDTAIYDKMREALSTDLLSNPLARTHAFEVAAQNKITVKDILPSHKLAPKKQLMKAKDSLTAVGRDIMHLMLTHADKADESEVK
ncbi:ParA family protein [Pseudoalteromonas marina]|uniref:ParA family protein n=1 Tax=Pseudoalteromonas marina TaxID=267375 RepID=A0ABT9FGH5_9GAMM|nr:ParA family protein [Pseudoalteromonas marina]MDP2565891.1 ParA family protein [Pseudoalteromonas marina]